MSAEKIPSKRSYDRNQRRAFLLRILFLSSAAVLFASCGDVPGPARPRSLGSNFTANTVVADSECLALLQRADSDSDGLSDHDEFFGTKDKAGNIFYTNAFASDTDGDGRKDGDEFKAVTYAGTSETVNIQLSPIAKDYVVRVFARGGSNSSENASATTGWNSFSLLNIQAGTQVTLEDTLLQQWQSNGQSSDTKGLSEGLRCDDSNTCLNAVPRLALIGRYSDGTAPFLMGNSWTSGVLSSAKTLQLRANDRDDSIALGDNTGFLALKVTMTSSSNVASTVYPQLPPTPEQKTAFYAKICTPRL